MWDDVHEQRVSAIERRLKAGEERFKELEDRVKATAEHTAEILEIVSMGKVFFKLAGVFGTVMKWIAGIAAAVIAILSFFHHPGLPK